jgi:hypothetical protein
LVDLSVALWVAGKAVLWVVSWVVSWVAPRAFAKVDLLAVASVVWRVEQWAVSRADESALQKVVEKAGKSVVDSEVL